MATAAEPRPRWLLLIHQLPPTPAYLRVKTARQLQKVGAVAIKNSVYVLPNTDAAHESLTWVAKEIAGDLGNLSGTGVTPQSHQFKTTRHRRGADREAGLN